MHTLHVQGKLPHSSVLYKSTQNKINIDCSIHSNYKNLIENNIKKFFENKEGFYTISMDEIHIIPRIRWNPLNNEIMGFCYNHSKNIRMTFTSRLILDDIKKEFSLGKIHIAKEALIVSISNKIFIFNNY